MRKPIKTAKAKPLTPAQKLDAIGIEAICERVAEAEFYADIANSAGVSRHALMNWLNAHEDVYAPAREARAHKIAEDMLEIADDSSIDKTVDAEGNIRTDHEVVARSRLRVDTRKWLASKMLPKVYGDKVDLNHGGQPDGVPIVHKIELVALKQ